MEKNGRNICKLDKSTSYDLYENGATVIGDYQDIQFSDTNPSHHHCLPPTDVLVLTPAGLLDLIGLPGITGIVGVKRRD